MLKVVQKESKNKEEVLNKCLEELNVNSSEVYFYIEESASVKQKPVIKSKTI